MSTVITPSGKMKAAFIFLVFLVAASATYINSERNIFLNEKSTIEKADKEFLIRNKNLIRLLSQLHSWNPNQDQVTIGKEYNIENNLDKYTNVAAVKDFLNYYKISSLPKHRVFAITNKRQMNEAARLFHVLYSAKDFDTFYKTACWARENINESLFQYAFTAAILHRSDTRGVNLPPPYEVNPFHYIPAEVIQKAGHLKMQEKIQDNNLADFYEIQQEGNNFIIRNNYSGWFDQINEESALNYFTEDVGLNAFYLYNTLANPIWLTKDVGFKIRSGEWLMYMHHQINARYYMERLSNGFGEIPNFTWDKPIKTGYKSSLRYINGQEFPSRPNNFQVDTEDNLWDITSIKDWERRIRDAIALGFIYSEDGRKVSLRNPEDAEILSSLVQSNKDCPNRKFFINVLYTISKVLGNGEYHENDYLVNPTILETYETMLRDPMLYQFAKHILDQLSSFDNNLHPYTREEVDFPGVRLQDVTVDKLVTYYDFFDVDITNSVYRNKEEVKENRDKTKFTARQARLNHIPFNIKFDIVSDKTTDAVVRVFLGPKYDSTHRPISFWKNRRNFFEMDHFIYNVKNGKNSINRNSRDFTLTKEDFITTKDLYAKLNNAIDGNEEFLHDQSGNRRTKFPDRLVLPKGRKNGMQFQLYVVVTPLHTTKTYTTHYPKHASIPNRYTPIRQIDDISLGYPLDRRIDHTAFWNPNMILKDVTIYHSSEMNLNKNSSRQQ